MKLKIFYRCSLFPSWSGWGLINTFVLADMMMGTNIKVWW